MALTLRSLRLTCFSVILSVLSGCETVENTYDRVYGLWDEPVVLPCPDYRILSDAARIVQFREGQGRDLIDVNIDSRIHDLTMECITSLDKETQLGNMGVDVKVAFNVKRGPANVTKKALLTYFVSVIDQKKNILYREEFLMSGRFAGNQSAMYFFGETIKLELPLTRKISSRDYIIYVGFLLNREQLIYNQRSKTQRGL